MLIAGAAAIVDPLAGVAVIARLAGFLGFLLIGQTRILVGPLAGQLNLSGFVWIILAPAPAIIVNDRSLPHRRLVRLGLLGSADESGRG